MHVAWRLLLASYPTFNLVISFKAVIPVCQRSNLSSANLDRLSLLKSSFPENDDATNYGINGDAGDSDSPTSDITSRDALKKALRDGNFAIATESKFVDPNENDVGNYVSRYELEKYLQEELAQKNYPERDEDRKMLLNQNTKADSSHLKGVFEIDITSSSETEDASSFSDGMQLNPDDYIELSQYVGFDDPSLSRGGSFDDGYSAVLNRAFSNKQKKDGRDIIDSEVRYRSVVRSLAMPSPDSPEVVVGGRAATSQPRDPNLNDLMEAWRVATLMKNRTSEELHQQVFQEEEGFMKQSELFRESLSDASKTREAFARRRAATFEARQETARTKLQKEIEEMQAILAKNQQWRCSVCDCIMSKDECEKTKKLHLGKAVCDVCYAEIHFVRLHGDEPSPDPQAVNARFRGSSSLSSSYSLRRESASPRYNLPGDADQQTSPLPQHSSDPKPPQRQEEQLPQLSQPKSSGIPTQSSSSQGSSSSDSLRRESAPHRHNGKVDAERKATVVPLHSSDLQPPQQQEEQFPKLSQPKSSGMSSQSSSLSQGSPSQGSSSFSVRRESASTRYNGNVDTERRPTALPRQSSELKQTQKQEGLRPKIHHSKLSRTSSSSSSSSPLSPSPRRTPGGAPPRQAYQDKRQNMRWNQWPDRSSYEGLYEASSKGEISLRSTNGSDRGRMSKSAESNGKQLDPPQSKATSASEKKNEQADFSIREEELKGDNGE
ncbi:hypothetical protein ACA910_016413 [Epithemia clementina (nom. ined.)]